MYICIYEKLSVQIFEIQNQIFPVKNNLSMIGGQVNSELDPELVKQIDAIAEIEIKNLNKIDIGDLCGLNQRVYERSNTKIIEPIIYVPPKVSSLIEQINSKLNECKTTTYGYSCVFTNA